MRGWPKASPATSASSTACSTSPTTWSDGEVVHPQDVVRHDGDDPYLVVAADKGTATFSDIANAHRARARLLAGRRVRLGRLGRLRPQGAWASPRRARGNRSCATSARMGRDCQKRGFHLRRHRRHVRRRVRQRHAAVEAHPPARGVRPPPHLPRSEPGRRRRRSRSAAACSSCRARRWDDYDKTLISKGGGVYPRSAKSIAADAGSQGRARHRCRRSRR